MAVTTFTGILAAVVTPFTADGSAIDAEGIRRQADHIIGVTKPAGGISNIIFKPNIGDFSELEKEIGLPEEKVRREGA